MSLTAHSSLKSEEPKEKGYFKEGNNLDTLGDIYQEDTNMAIWKRELDNAIQKAANVIIDTNPSLEISRVVSPDDTYAEINKLNSKNEITKCNYLDQERAKDLIAF